MASGKSTFARLLARKMNLDFIDLDTYITEKTQKTIHEIFQKDGEDVFRLNEKECLKELMAVFTGIIALGGGALQDQELTEKVKSSGLLINIYTPLEVIVERVAEDRNRPILFNESGEIKPKQVLFDELKTLYFRRLKYYRQAHFSLDCRDYSSILEMADAAINNIYAYD